MGHSSGRWGAPRPRSRRAPHSRSPTARRSSAERYEGSGTMRRLGVSPNRRRSLSLAAAPVAGRPRASAGDCSDALGREIALTHHRNGVQIDPCGADRAGGGAGCRAVDQRTRERAAGGCVRRRRRPPRAPCTPTGRMTAGCSAANGSTRPTRATSASRTGGGATSPAPPAGHRWPSPTPTTPAT